MSARATVAIAAVAVLVSGCGQRLVDGEYLGDATIRLTGFMEVDVGQPRHPVAGALWLGYSGLSAPLEGVETTVLPVSSLAFTFTCDVIGSPPSSGHYASADDTIIPAAMRIGRLVFLDDADGNGRFGLDDTGQLVAPDRLLAVAADQALVFIDQPPADPGALEAAHLWLANWHLADRGYHLVQLDGDPAAPDQAAHVIDDHAHVIFSPPPPQVRW